MRRVFAVLLILTGLGLLTYPWARGYYHDYRQRQLLRAWEEMQVTGEERPSPGEDPEEPAELPELDQSERAQQRYILENMIGVLRIPAIELEMPVLKVDSAANLDISLAHVAGSAEPGERGNFCIAGHRQLEYGRHFNRLHQVREGDLLEFTGRDGALVYRVFEARVIDPEDTRVLEGSGQEKLITLIACHGTRRPFTRFIVKGQLEEVAGAGDS